VDKTNCETNYRNCKGDCGVYLTAKTDAGDKKRRRLQRRFTVGVHLDNPDKCLICGATGVAMFKCKLCRGLICYTCVVQKNKTCPNCAPEKVIYT